MLIISRYIDQETVITVPPSTTPTIIVHKIVDIRGDKVRCGWTAPKHVRINRLEVEQVISSGASNAD